ncbi:uncharacterized protein [Branchiostoma lanceolatum]|uniref:uncharacterized protein n=1 Tax=Branchiostoma lanceolatum TaxID=7740 RepID=UPI0034572401
MPDLTDGNPDHDDDGDEDDDKDSHKKEIWREGPDRDRMPDLTDGNPDHDDDGDEDDEGSHKKEILHVLRGSERKPVPFWNKTHLCDYHECFSKLKTWPEVSYYLLKDGNFEVDWPTIYIRQFMIYYTNAFVNVFNRDRAAVEKHAMEAISVVDKTFRALNIRVLLAGVDIVEDYWPGEGEGKKTTYPLLDLKIRKYIWKKLRAAHTFDTAVFVTGPPYFNGGGFLGVAMFELCSTPYTLLKTSSIERARPADMIGIIPHEMGHWFNRKLGHVFDPLQSPDHDGDRSYRCPGLKLFGAKCAMGGNQYPKTFGEFFVQAVRTTEYPCLKNKPSQSEVFRCGNGVLDYGEECDCGSSQDCLERDPCCDGQICKLKQGAQCADGQACCKNCKVDMENCPVDSSSPVKRGWTQLSDDSTYTEITSPPSGMINAIPFGKLTPQNKVFSWLLRAPTYKRVEVQLIMPAIKSGYFEVWIGCPYDWVEVRDGGKATSPLIGRYCTPLRDNNIVSSSNELLVRLRSDGSFDSHFTMTYTFVSQEEQQIPVPDETCQTGNGVSYRGTADTTYDGRACLPWDKHGYEYTKAKYGEKFGLDKNYCRNPDNEKAVWCYTHVNHYRPAAWSWQYCTVPKCGAGKEIPEKTCQKGNGLRYRGTVNITIEGRPCLPWDAHSHYYTKSRFGEKYGLYKNYCRNPGEEERVWCYIKSSHKSLYWQYCSVPQCGAGKEIPDETCQKGNGVSYRGTVSMTHLGIPCLPWDQHSHGYTKAKSGAKYGLYKNYCRNPGADEDRVWCYIKTSFDSVYWDYCPVPKCDAVDVSPEVQDVIKDAGECYKDRGQSYRGTTAMSWKGEPCLDWVWKFEKYNPKTYPDSDLNENYCRNPTPGPDYAPWCFLTTSSKLKWDYCAIPKCLKNNGT